MTLFYSKYFKYFIAVVLVALSCIVVIIHLDNPWLWYDEAGQFWMSKGLNHYSDPFSTSQGVSAVIENNRFYNLDPGGFSVLLHYWLMISDNYIFIRVLPLFFFIGLAFFFYKTLLKYNCEKFYAFVCAMLLFLWPITISRMVEIRAYSMSMLGFIWAIYYLKVCEESNYSISRLFVYSVVLSFFCTARYESIIFTIPISLYVLFYIFKLREKWLSKSLIYGMPLLLTVALVYLESMRFQNASAAQVTYSDYLGTDYTLFYGKLFLFYIINMAIIVYSYFKNKKLSQIEIITIICPTAFVLLSLVGKYPWNNTRTISVLLVLIMNFIIYIWNIGNKFEYAKLFLIVIVLIGLGGRNFIQKTGLKQYESFVQVANSPMKIIYVDDWFEPSIRYAYEYGNFKDRIAKDGYPNTFIFQRVKKNWDGDKRHTIYLDMPSQTDADIYLIGRHYEDVKNNLKYYSTNIFTK